MNVSKHINHVFIDWYKMPLSHYYCYNTVMLLILGSTHIVYLSYCYDHYFSRNSRNSCNLIGQLDHLVLLLLTAGRYIL